MPLFKELRGIIESLCSGFDKYRTYLKRQGDTITWKLNQGSLTPCRTISESIQLQPVPVTKQQYS